MNVTVRTAFCAERVEVNSWWLGNFFFQNKILMSNEWTSFLVIINFLLCLAVSFPSPAVAEVMWCATGNMLFTEPKHTGYIVYRTVWQGKKQMMKTEGIYCTFLHSSPCAASSLPIGSHRTLKSHFSNLSEGWSLKGSHKKPPFIQCINSIFTPSDLSFSFTSPSQRQRK